MEYQTQQQGLQAIENEKMTLAKNIENLEQRARIKSIEIQEIKASLERLKRGNADLWNKVGGGGYPAGGTVQALGPGTFAQPNMSPNQHQTDVLEQCLENQQQELVGLVREKSRLSEQVEVLEEQARIKSFQLDLMKATVGDLRRKQSPSRPMTAPGRLNRDQLRCPMASHGGQPCPHFGGDGRAAEGSQQPPYCYLPPCRYDTTPSGLRVAIEGLKNKAQTKDQIISAMADELRSRAQTNEWNDLVNRLGQPTGGTVPDYDRSRLCENLTRPQAPTATGFPPRPQTPASYPQVSSPPTPRRFQVIRQVDATSVLLSWDPPTSGTVTGYEIYVNDVLHDQIRSASRCQAMVQNVNLKQENVFSLYAMNQDVRSHEPADVLYPCCPTSRAGITTIPEADSSTPTETALPPSSVVPEESPPRDLESETEETDITADDITEPQNVEEMQDITGDEEAVPTEQGDLEADGEAAPTEEVDLETDGEAVPTEQVELETETGPESEEGDGSPQVVIEEITDEGGEDTGEPQEIAAETPTDDQEEVPAEPVDDGEVDSGEPQDTSEALPPEEPQEQTPVEPVGETPVEGVPCEGCIPDDGICSKRLKILEDAITLLKERADKKSVDMLDVKTLLGKLTSYRQSVEEEAQPPPEQEAAQTEEPEEPPAEPSEETGAETEEPPAEPPEETGAETEEPPAEPPEETGAEAEEPPAEPSEETGAEAEEPPTEPPEETGAEAEEPPAEPPEETGAEAEEPPAEQAEAELEEPPVESEEVPDDDATKPVVDETASTVTTTSSDFLSDDVRTMLKELRTTSSIHSRELGEIKKDIEEMKREHLEMEPALLQKGPAVEESAEEASPPQEGDNIPEEAIPEDTAPEDGESPEEVGAPPQEEEIPEDSIPPPEEIPEGPSSPPAESAVSSKRGSKTDEPNLSPHCGESKSSCAYLSASILQQIEDLKDRAHRKSLELEELKNDVQVMLKEHVGMERALKPSRPSGESQVSSLVDDLLPPPPPVTPAEGLSEYVPADLLGDLQIDDIDSQASVPASIAAKTPLDTISEIPGTQEPGPSTSEQFSESDYSRHTADDFPFGEDGVCILEPPIEPRIFTDDELDAAFDETPIEPVVLGSKERLFDLEFPQTRTVSAAVTAPPDVQSLPPEPAAVTAPPDVQSLPLESTAPELQDQVQELQKSESQAFSESDYSRHTVDDFPFGEDGDCILEPPIEPRIFTDDELDAAFDEPPIEPVELGSKERLFDLEFPQIRAVSAAVTAPPDVQSLPSQTTEFTATELQEQVHELQRRARQKSIEMQDLKSTVAQLQSMLVLLNSRLESGPVPAGSLPTAPRPPSPRVSAQPYQTPATQYPAYPGPSYPAPGPSYGAPGPSYGAPGPSYGAPGPCYQAPCPSYPAPGPSYPPPGPSYPAPGPSYPAPGPSYPAPGFGYPPQGASYSAPGPICPAPAPPCCSFAQSRTQSQSYWPQQEMMSPVQHSPQCIALRGSAADLFPVSLQQRTPSVEDISQLASTLQQLQAKCQDKDQMISVMANELRLYADSHIWEAMLEKIASDEQHYSGPPADFDASKLSQYLARPGPYD